MKRMSYPPRNVTMMRYLPHAYRSVSAEFDLLEIENYMERVLCEENVLKAFKRVVSNRGCSGEDGISVKDLEKNFEFLWAEQEVILRNGTWNTSSLMRVEVEKHSGGGERILSIPTVMDRVVHQAVAQVLACDWEGVFCEQSYGYRPMRSAGMAVEKAWQSMRGEQCYVADLDIRSFFDTVNHAVLEERLRNRVSGSGAEAIWGLCMKIVKSPIMINDVVQQNELGIPQGSPLSPLLANIYLHGLDEAMLERGYEYVRYADDMLVVSSSKSEAEAAMQFCKSFLSEELKLQLHEEKSAVLEVSSVEYLGFEFKRMAEKWMIQPKAGVEKEVIESLDELCKEALLVDDVLRNRLGQLVMGWKQYFSQFDEEMHWPEVDAYAVKRFREAYWESWNSGAERLDGLERLGVSREQAVSLQGVCMQANEVSKHPLMLKAIPNDILKPWGVILHSEKNVSVEPNKAKRIWQKSENNKKHAVNVEEKEVLDTNERGTGWLKKRSLRLRLGSFFELEYLRFSK